MKRRLFNQKTASVILITLGVLTAQAQVKLSTNFISQADRKEPLHDVWQVANDIAPTYEGSRDDAQIRPDLKMNVIRLSGGVGSGSKDLDYDMVRWSNAANDYVYDFTRLLRVIDKADQHGDEIYQLVIDNVPWAFQRGYTFVDLDKRDFDGVHFRKFEEVEQYGNALPPSDMGEYRQYVEALMQTLVDEYGIQRVRKWRFRVGSEIESPGHWKGTAEDFIEYLDVSMRAIRKVVPNAHVGVHTREPNYRAVSHRGVNYKGEPFVSFHREILNHCANNNLRIDSWGLSYYIQFDNPGNFDVSEAYYQHSIAALVNHPKWDDNTEINLEEFKATASFRSPDGRFATLKSESSHGEVAHIAMTNLFYKHKELNQIHRWLQYKNVKDDIANSELLSMVGNTRYETRVSGKPDHASNIIDGIFSFNEGSKTIEALIYNYNEESTNYVAAEDVNLSLVTDLPVGTTVRYRTAQYTRSHNKLQSFANEDFFQNSWYIDGTEVGQRLGEASRILKDEIYNNQYRNYDGHLKYGLGGWLQTTTVARSDGNTNGSEIAVSTNLFSFSFRKFEFSCEECNQQNNKAPQVAFANSSTNLTLTEGYTPFQILANATDADGQDDIANVQLLLDGTLVRQETLAPYEWNENPELTQDDVLDKLSLGSHVLKLIVTDNQGATGEATLTITVVEANKKPILSFTKPVNNQVFEEGTSVVINVAASDPNTNGSIVGVELYLDGSFIREETIASYDWNPANHPEDLPLNKLSIGNHTLRAVAKDDQGATSETTITINVKALPRDCNNDINGTAEVDDCDVCSGGNTGIPVNDCITGVKEEQTNVVKLYPNPTQNMVTINLDTDLKNASIRVINLAGKTVFEQPLSQRNTQISLNSLEKGVYIISINNGEEIFNRKLTKE